MPEADELAVEPAEAEDEDELINELICSCSCSCGNQEFGTAFRSSNAFAQKLGANPDDLRMFISTISLRELSPGTVNPEIADCHSFRAAGGELAKTAFMRQFCDAVLSCVNDEYSPLTRR